MPDVALIVLLLFAAYGYWAWGHREALRRDREVWRRRHAQPRRRALPPAPATEEKASSA